MHFRSIRKVCPLSQILEFWFLTIGLNTGIRSFHIICLQNILQVNFWFRWKHGSSLGHWIIIEESSQLMYFLLFIYLPISMNKMLCIPGSRNRFQNQYILYILSSCGPSYSIHLCLWQGWLAKGGHAQCSHEGNFSSLSSGAIYLLGFELPIVTSFLGDVRMLQLDVKLQI